MKNNTPTNRRTVEDAVRIVWKIIDEANASMQDPMLTPEEKRAGPKP